MRYQLHALICIRSSSDWGAILANQFRLKMYQDGGMHELGSLAESFQAETSIFWN